MTKSNFIEDDKSLAYKKRLREFMQQINPKPTIEQIEQLRQRYLRAREK
ncbi:hypothetical protein [Bacillus sp. JJ1474]